MACRPERTDMFAPWADFR